MAGRALKFDSRKPIQNVPDTSAVSIHTRPVTEDAIATRAYQIWQARGCLADSAYEDWFQAENELKGIELI